MKPFTIPVVGIGPGSQPAEDPPQLLDMPRDISGFVMPQVPETGDRERFAEARDVIRQLVEAVSNESATQSTVRLELTDLARPTIDLLNQMLLEGEVSALLTSPRGTVKIQETNFAGVWRLLHYSAGGELVHDFIEACPVPDAILRFAEESSLEQVDAPPAPAGVMNSPSVLVELQEQAARYRPGDTPHVINLTLLPLSPQDLAHLDASVPVGPVAILTRGYGKCRVSSTTRRHVWRVQYFNNMNTLILNTFEVVDIPEVTKAAPEDLEDSLERLRELLDWMEQE